MSEIATLPLAALAAVRQFRSDPRFATLGEQEEPASPPDMPVDDPLAAAWADGFATGTAEAGSRAMAGAAIEAAASEALGVQFARLDNEMAEALRQRLYDTIVALCESALAPLALDGDALLRRIDRAVALLQRAGDERTIRLNPADMALLSDRFRTDWAIVPDTALPRGALRIETSDGGIEDGPAQWRQAIAEALQ